jgi:hypothetical protein
VDVHASSARAGGADSNFLKLGRRVDGKK